MAMVCFSKRWIAALSIAFTAGCISGGSATDDSLLTPDASGLVITFSTGPDVAPKRDDWCGFTWYARSWHYTMFIQNTANEPFVVTTWERLTSATGSFLPAETFVGFTEIERFTQAFGSTTIPAKQTVQAVLCDAPNNPSNHRYRLKNAAGTSHDSPTLRFQP
jgi:hypothetical protein